MKNHLTMVAKSLAVAIAILAVLTFSQGVARADEVTISGSTTGTVTGVPQLTFVGGSFIGTTALGEGALSGFNSLGAFTLGTGPLQEAGGSFLLNITFTGPAGINGGQGATYLAAILGTVAPNVNQGGVLVHFHNPVQTFTFNDGITSGSFSLRIPELFIQTGQSAFLTAGFSGEQTTAVPEPATLLLLGTGLTGIAAKLRQRRKAHKAGIPTASNS